ncbi:hypothetical protein TNCV_5053661 [Trichonephila clavipes]|nr:hypothetical protein TNCV_5053661 [Trichonephila clavipes]
MFNMLSERWRRDIIIHPYRRSQTSLSPVLVYQWPFENWELPLTTQMAYSEIHIYPKSDWIVRPLIPPSFFLPNRRVSTPKPHRKRRQTGDFSNLSDQWPIRSA